MTHAIADHALFAWFAGQPVVVGQFQTFLTVIIDIGKTKHVRGHLAGRIEAAKFALAIDARNAQIKHGLCGFRRHLATQKQKLAVGALLKALLQFFGIGTQCLCQLRNPVFVLEYFRRVGPDRHHRRGYRQRLAVAIENRPTRNRNRHLAQKSCITLTLIELLADHLQIESTGHQPKRRKPEQADHHGHAFAGARAGTMPTALSRWWVWLARNHQCSNRMSCGRGLTMPSF